MITVRKYRESTDAARVGRLIAETFTAYNLGFASEEELPLLLGPFAHAGSTDPDHQARIRAVIRSQMVYVAVDGQEIVGVLRGRTDRLASLFVAGNRHRSGVGRQLVARFERDAARLSAARIKVAATLYGLPFYLRMAYKKSAGLRLGRSFEGRGLPEQPMSKRLDRPSG